VSHPETRNAAPRGGEGRAHQPTFAANIFPPSTHGTRDVGGFAKKRRGFPLRIAALFAMLGKVLS
jgi:hypothetical protein